MPKKTKEQKEDLSLARISKRSGAYVPNSTNTGIVKAPKAAQKVYKAKMRTAIKGIKRGL